jgi:hypothetical protein
MVQIARQSALKPPRTVAMDMTRARCRIASLRMARETVSTSWMAEAPVGMMLIFETERPCDLSQIENGFTLLDGQRLMKIM